MGTSVYYEATRSAPLTDAETDAIHAMILEHSSDIEPGVNFFGEDFDLYVPEGEKVLHGATKLPFDSLRSMIDATNRWYGLLTQIRREVLPDAQWVVHVDGAETPWDTDRGYVIDLPEGFDPDEFD